MSLEEGSLYWTGEDWIPIHQHLETFSIIDPPILGIYKLHQDSHDIVKATEGSACFDIKACLKEGTEVKFYDSQNSLRELTTERTDFGLHPGERALIPTGLVFDIPEGYSLRLHPRSGLSFNHGITLNNAEGIIDSDYVEELFVSVINTSSDIYYLQDGDRICQAELVENQEFDIQYMDEKPKQKTDRAGGFGHSGK